MKKPVLLILSFLGILVSLLFLDWVLVPSLFLHNDPCYYHNHDAPFLIGLFFVDSNGHVEPPFSLPNLILVLTCSVILTVLVSRNLLQRKIFENGAKKKIL